MDTLTHITNKIRERLAQSNHTVPEQEAVAYELVPAVLSTLATDHRVILENIHASNQNPDDAILLQNTQMQSALTDAIEKVTSVFVESYTEEILNNQATDIVANDTKVLLATPETWARLREKTYQALLNDVVPGNNDERVYLWVEEIKKTTGISPETNETVGTFAIRAIAHFLKQRK